MSSDISLGIFVAFLVIGLVAALGLVFGLYFGERGRRRDLVWLVEKTERPRDDELRAEVEESKEGDSEANARRRAEISAVVDGLTEEMRAMGKPVDRAKIEAEALELVAMMDTEIGEGMG